MSSKIPAFQFYPEDWLSNSKLQLCPFAAKGLLIDLMCYMHQSEKYGYLLINGLQPSHKEIRELLRMNHRTFTCNLSILLEKGVLKEDDDGSLYCRRMVEDQHLRNIRREAGKLGGNPKLLIQRDNQDDNQNVPPSSPVSSPTPTSPTKKKEEKRAHGEYGNVKLTDAEHEKLIAEYGTEKARRYLSNLDEYIGYKGAKYKSHYLTIKSWIRRDKDGENNGQQNSNRSGRSNPKYTERAEDDPGRSKVRKI